jgi:Bacterial Ig-like domain (group 3)/FG-GAP-like repeat
VAGAIVVVLASEALASDPVGPRRPLASRGRLTASVRVVTTRRVAWGGSGFASDRLVKISPAARRGRLYTPVPALTNGPRLAGVRAHAAAGGRVPIEELSVAERGRLFTSDWTGQAELPFDPAFQDHPYDVLPVDLNGDGVPDMAAANIDNNTVAILSGQPDPNNFNSFNFTNYGVPATVVPVHSNPRSLVAADFNGDGKMDLAVSNSGVSLSQYTSVDADTITILYGNGDFTFRTVDIPVRIHPGALAVADVNHDGRPDIIAAFPAEGLVGVIRNLGNGNFAPPQYYDPGLGRSPDLLFGVAAGDLSGNGYPDIVVTNVEDPQGRVAVLRNDRRGGFLRPAYYYAADPHAAPNARGAGTKSPVLVDLTHSGHLDLIVANWLIDSIAVFKGNGHGKFAPAVRYTARWPFTVTTGDFHLDGKTDIAYGMFYPEPPPPPFDTEVEQVRILYGNGDGTFENGPGHPADQHPVQFAPTYPGITSLATWQPHDFRAFAYPTTAVRDIGRLSLIAGTANYTSGELEVQTPIVLFENADGPPQDPAPPLAVPGHPYVTFVRSLLGPDTGGSNLTLFSDLAAADLTGNGRADLIALRGWGGTGENVGVCAPGYVSVYMSQGGNLAFAPPVSYASGGLNPVSVAVADVNGDGIPDVIVANAGGLNTSACGIQGGNLAVFLANRDGTLRPPKIYLQEQASIKVRVGRLRPGALPDIVVVLDDGEKQVLLNNGDGSFHLGQRLGGDTNFFTAGRTLDLADVNGDGILDLVSTSPSNEEGRGGEEAFGHDGPLPVRRTSVSVNLGNGDGTFKSVVPASSPHAEGYPLQVFRHYNRTGLPVVADVNGDGKLDLVFGGSLVLYGRGDGTFSGEERVRDQPRIEYTNETPSWTADDPIGNLQFYSIRGSAVADLNGDGTPDLITDQGSNLYIIRRTPDVVFNNLAIMPSAGGVFQQPVEDQPTDTRPQRYLTSPDIIPIGDRYFEDFTGTPNTNFEHQPVVADFAGDGSRDVAITSTDEKIWLFRFERRPPSGPQATSITNLGSTTLTYGVKSDGLVGDLHISDTAYSSPVPLAGAQLTTTVDGDAPFCCHMSNRSGYFASLDTIAQRQPLDAGHHTLRVQFGNDGWCPGSPTCRLQASTLTLGFDVLPAPTTTSVIADPNPAVFANKIALTATVSTPSAAPPVGLVQFRVGSANIGPPAPVINGVAVVATRTLGVGSHTLTAAFLGSHNFQPSSGTSSASVSALQRLSGPIAGGLHLGAGTWSLEHASVSGGPVVADTGAEVSITNSSLAAGLRADGAGEIVVCHTAIAGGVSLAHGTGPIVLGDQRGGDCRGDNLEGGVVLDGNRAGLEVADSTVAGSLVVNGNSGIGDYAELPQIELERDEVSGQISCAANTPPPTADGNALSAEGGLDGQCRTMGDGAPLASTLPLLTNGAYGRTSVVTIQNTAPYPALVRTVYYDRGGHSVGVEATTWVRPYASLDVRQDDGHAFHSAGGDLAQSGSAIVFGNAPVHGVVNEYIPGHDDTSYTSLRPDESSSSVFLPQVENADVGLTSILHILNTGDVASNVSVTYRDRAGSTVTTQDLQAVPAHGLVSVGVSAPAASGGPGLSPGFAGTAVVQATGNQPVAAVVDVQGPNAQLASYGAASGAVPVLLVPHFVRSSADSHNSRLYIENTTSFAASLKLTYVDQGGGVITVPGLSVPANGSLALDALGPSGPGRDGIFGLRIDSDQPIVGVVDEVSSSADARSAFEASPGAVAPLFLPIVESPLPGTSDGVTTTEAIMNTGATPTAVAIRYFLPGSGQELPNPDTLTLQPGQAGEITQGPGGRLSSLPQGLRATALVTADPETSLAAVVIEESAASLSAYRG